MRELVINSYHRVKDDQENRAPLIAFTSLNIGRDDMMERSRMRQDLGRSLRTQMTLKNDRERTESAKRMMEGV